VRSTARLTGDVRVPPATQLTSKLLENKYITLGNVLHISNALKDTARSSGGGGESFFAKGESSVVRERRGGHRRTPSAWADVGHDARHAGLDKVRKGLLSGVKTHPDRDKLLSTSHIQSRRVD
jgi:hypothetical protein